MIRHEQDDQEDVQESPLRPAVLDDPSDEKSPGTSSDLADSTDRSIAAIANPDSYSHPDPTLHPDIGESASTDSALAEVDLVEHLLQERDGLRDLALQLITSRADMEQVNWAPTQEMIPTDHEWVPVVYRDQNLGVLSAAPPASKQQLMPGLRGWLAGCRWIR